jgi:hypothetical protein
MYLLRGTSWIYNYHYNLGQFFDLKFIKQNISFVY